MRNLIKIIACFFLFSSIVSCGGFKKVDARKVPISGPERAKKNVREGRGVSLGSMMNKGRGSTNYEFSTSNPMWRAAFEVIDFMPLVTVDYSGGTIITDWYTDKRAPQESLKFTIRFLSSEVRADSVKIIIHKKVCSQSNNCVIKKISSQLEGEIRTAIIKKAALMSKQLKNSPKEKNKKKKKGLFGFGKDKDKE